MLTLLAAPFAACLIIAAIHCYMGLHIIRRGVIFVDLALAQMAALGGTVALLVGPLVLGPAGHHYEAPAASSITQPAVQASASAQDANVGDEHSVKEAAFGYGMALLFAFLGAGLISISRFRDNRVPHEAMIGIVYVVSAALAMLILNKSPHGAEEAENMMLGHVLFVSWGEVGRDAVLYLALAIPHLIWGRKFLLISDSLPRAEAKGLNVRFWDFLFYAMFGVMVTQSVRLVGVLVVFSFLIIPAVCAAIFFRHSFWRSLLFGWAIALVANILGLWFSAAADMPTGASLVAAFGLMLVVCSLVYRLIGRRQLTAPVDQSRAVHEVAS